MAELKTGEKVPAFSAEDENGKLLTDKDLAGKKYVLYFYPKDNTPTCTEQACNLRDNYEKLNAAGYLLFGISTDSARKHQNFIKKHALPFPLLVDEAHEMHENFGVWGQKKLFGKEYTGTIRTTFVVDETGKITDIIRKVKAKEHAAQILGEF